MYGLDRDELARLRRTPFWERIRQPRLAGIGAAAIALGVLGPMALPELADADSAVWIFGMIPVPTPYFFGAVWVIGVLSIALWVVATVRHRLGRAR